MRFSSLFTPDFTGFRGLQSDEVISPWSWRHIQTGSTQGIPVAGFIALTVDFVRKVADSRSQIAPGKLDHAPAGEIRVVNQDDATHIAVCAASRQQVEMGSVVRPFALEKLLLVDQAQEAAVDFVQASVHRFLRSPVEDAWVSKQASLWAANLLGRSQSLLFGTRSAALALVGVQVSSRR